MGGTAEQYVRCKSFLMMFLKKACSSFCVPSEIDDYFVMVIASSFLSTG